MLRSKAAEGESFVVIGSFAARWITQETVSAMSEVRYRLSVQG